MPEMTTTPGHEGRPGPKDTAGLARVRHMVRLWRNESTDPEPFYSALAAETTQKLELRVGPLREARIADLGCGPGYYAAALREAGAEVTPVDNSMDELELGGKPPPGFVLADAGHLPFADGEFDGVFCSNLLEHTPESRAVVGEISRITRRGGWAYISWTNWYSPWGGHNITPYHYLGPRTGPALYELIHGGPPAKNAVGNGLWPVHIGSILKAVRADPTVEVQVVEPRYWPRLKAIMSVPGLREFLAWNCVIWLRKR